MVLYVANGKDLREYSSGSPMRLELRYDTTFAAVSQGIRRIDSHPVQEWTLGVIRGRTCYDLYAQLHGIEDKHLNAFRSELVVV